MTDFESVQYESYPQIPISAKAVNYSCKTTLKREVFDLDGLKRINDRYGHLTGSHAICRVADVLSFCRDIDTAARYGGDEFAIVLPETGAEAANQVAQRIRDSIANDGMEPLISVSIGVAVYPRDGERIEALFRAADTAMYSMKAKKHELLEAT
jgi:diguanylate cyclase (GGDEF)-like protein